MQNPLITKELNLIDIVTHRMGFETFQGDFMYWTSDLNEDNVIEKFSQSIPKYDFRTKYGYTNAGYTIAGKVIEKVSGLRWEDYIKENIFLPLKMDRTTALSVDFAKSDNVANPHTLVNGKVKILPFENIDNLAPCGSIGSSLNDLTNWLIVQLDSGRIEGINVIPYEVIEKTRTPHTIIRRGRHPFNKSHFSLYGLGWVLEDYEGTEIISHTGGVNGFVTSVTLIPEKKLGIVVLTNTDQNAFFQAIKWEIIDSYLGLPFRNYNDYMFEREMKQNEIRVKNIKEWKDSVSMKLYPDLKINEFIGNYLHEVYGYANISLKENYLELKLQHHSNLSGKLEYLGNNRFLCTYSDPMYGIKVFPFKIENEKVISFDLYVDDFIDFMPYKFIKE
jgi:CubicO group peptidase (beta-lactamase class C family)